MEMGIADSKTRLVTGLIEITVVYDAENRLCYCRWFRWWGLLVNSKYRLNNWQYIRHIDVQLIDKPDFQHCRLYQLVLILN